MEGPFGFSRSNELDSTHCLHPSSSSPIQHPRRPKGRLIWGELASLSSREPPWLKCWEVKPERCERVEGTITPWPEKKKNKRQLRLQQPTAGGLTSHTPASRSIRGIWWRRCMTHPPPHAGNLWGKILILWFLRMAVAAGLTRRPASFSKHQKIRVWTQQRPKSTRQQRNWHQSGNRVVSINLLDLHQRRPVDHSTEWKLLFIHEICGSSPTS